MSMEHVAKEEWPSFLERFSRGHVGWLARVERMDPTCRGDVESVELPLEGIVEDPLVPEVLVFIGSYPERLRRYRIENPKNLWRETAGGAVRLEFESADGTETVLACRPRAH